MSLLSGFLTNQLLKALQDEFLKHEPEIQDKILEEINFLGEKCLEWVDEKMGIKRDK